MVLDIILTVILFHWTHTFISILFGQCKKAVQDETRWVFEKLDKVRTWMERSFNNHSRVNELKVKKFIESIDVYEKALTQCIKQLQSGENKKTTQTNVDFVWTITTMKVELIRLKTRFEIDHPGCYTEYLKTVVESKKENNIATLEESNVHNHDQNAS
jgi:hypothetical protein